MSSAAGRVQELLSKVKTSPAAAEAQEVRDIEGQMKQATWGALGKWGEKGGLVPRIVVNYVGTIIRFPLFLGGVVGKEGGER